MKKVLMIHGFTGNGDGVWFPWMKRKLEVRGYEVFTPHMPNTWHPDLDRWLATAEPYMNKLGTEDILVGHSLGGKLAMHLVLKHRKKIGRLVLVAPAIGYHTSEEWEKRAKDWHGDEVPALRKFWECYLPWQDVAPFANVTAIFSDDDTAVPFCGKEILPKEWNYKLLHGLGHICQNTAPEVLNEILK